MVDHAKNTPITPAGTDPRVIGLPITSDDGRLNSLPVDEEMAGRARLNMAAALSGLPPNQSVKVLQMMGLVA